MVAINYFFSFVRELKWQSLVFILLILSIHATRGNIRQQSLNMVYKCFTYYQFAIDMVIVVICIAMRLRSHQGR